MSIAKGGRDFGSAGSWCGTQMPRKAGAQGSCNGRAEVKETTEWRDRARKWPGREEVAKEARGVS